MIIDYLELVDLVTLYCLNSDWMKTFDCDEVTRLRMFRLSRKMNESGLAKWVQEQWEKTYTEIEDSKHTP